MFLTSSKTYCERFGHQYQSFSTHEVRIQEEEKTTREIDYVILCPVCGDIIDTEEK